MLDLLLEKGANPNVVNDKGYCPLLVAIGKGNTALGKLLIEHGADVNAKDPYRWTALYYAIKTGDTDLVKLILARGAQPDVFAVELSEGRNPYHKDLNYPQITALLKPEVLRRQMLRAQAAVEGAQSPGDYQKAINEYIVASQLAPESPEIYYNLGLDLPCLSTKPRCALA